MKNIYYLIHSINFGDTLCATPTLRYLSQSHRKKINVVTHNKQVFNGNPYVDSLLSFDEYFSNDVGDIIKYESFTHAGRLDNNGVEKKFSHVDTRQLHANDLGFQLLPDQLTYDFYPSQQTLDIELPDEYVVLHVTTNWPNRTWSDENWVKLIDWLRENKIFTVLIGSGYREELHKSLGDAPLDKYCPTFENVYGIDLTNQGSMSDMWWILNDAKCLITMDSGPLHLAGCTNVNIIQLGSAIHPSFRAPFRYGRQDYNYTYVGGTCNLFCNSNLFYNIQEWGHINAVPPMPHCLENKPTFECHPVIDNVINNLKEVLSKESHNKFDSIIELNWNPDPNKIFFNFNVNTDLPIVLEVIDVNTGLKRGDLDDTARRMYDNNIWWVPSPGHLDGLGDVILKLYLDGKYYGEKMLKINGDNHLNVLGKNYVFNDIADNSYSTFWEVFLNKDYEREETCSVNDGDVVLDIGANYGFFTLYSINRGAKKVYSVEPYKTAYNHIKELSTIFQNIEPINKAISEEDGFINMFIHEGTSAINCVTNHGEMFGRTSNEVEVESSNINTLLSTIPEKIDFMKIDCEGSEYELFKTITNENLKKIKKIVIETHGEKNTNLVVDVLSKNKFKIFEHECSFDNKIIFAVK
jgi:FkbM family methyltransferase